MEKQHRTLTASVICQKAISFRLLVRVFLLIFVSGLLAGGFGSPYKASATMLDLTTAGSSGMINDALFEEGSLQPAGTGVIDSFVRISAAHQRVVEGYNTGYRPVEFDEITDPNFTRNLLLSEIPIVTIDDVDYRQFLLDINQDSGHRNLLSLDEIEIYQSALADETGYPSLGTIIYELDAGEDSWIKLDYDLNSGGSGKADMFAYIPDDFFTDDEYVYLYSKFGENNRNSDGYEEWAVEVTQPVPEPTTILLLVTGLAGLAGLWRKEVFKKS